MTARSVQILNDIDEKTDIALLDKLDALSEAKFTSQVFSDGPQKLRRCLRGTREDILHSIHRWATGGSSKPIFWMAGMAGTGKSTIVATAALSLQPTHFVVTYKFSRGRADLALSTKFVTTLAYQLAIGSPQMRRYILEALRKEPDIAKSALTHQFEVLFLGPLRTRHTATERKERLLVVVDAMDECDDSGVETFLQSLVSTTDFPALGVSLLLASRPERYIQEAFGNLSRDFWESLDLHDVDRTVVDQDIAAYIISELVRIADERSISDWPGLHDLSVLVDQSAGLFIFAATACRYAGASSPGGKPRKGLKPKVSPSDRLQHVTGRLQSSGKAMQELDTMYRMILADLFVGEDSMEVDEFHDVLEDCRNVIGCIALVYDTLSPSALANLAYGDGPDGLAMIMSTLEPLQAAISISSTHGSRIHILHESFRDFLLDRDRCTDGRLAFDRKKIHFKLAMGCLRVMEQGLRENICGFDSPSICLSDVPAEKVNASVPMALQYACSFWLAHLQGAKAVSIEETTVMGFLEIHALKWLEVLSLLGRLAQATASLATLESDAEMQHLKIHSYLHDLRRFMQSFQHGISQAPLQIYYCAAFFSPRQSFVRRIHEEQSALYARVQSQPSEEWHRYTLTIEQSNEWEGDPGRPGNQVLLLEDGSKVIQCSNHDGRSAINVWDTRTGARERRLLGHVGTSITLAISHVGCLLASTSAGHTIRLWDTPSFECRHIIYNKPTGPGHLSALRFSFDGSLLASVYTKERVRIWSTSTGNCIHTLEVRILMGRALPTDSTIPTCPYQPLCEHSHSLRCGDENRDDLTLCLCSIVEYAAMVAIAGYRRARVFSEIHANPFAYRYLGHSGS